ncbi:MAG: hypothetical protein ACREJ1_08895, partial [Candidatus Methylomirabilales bacterium]
MSGSAEQFGPELTAEGLTVEANVEPLRAGHLGLPPVVGAVCSVEEEELGLHSCFAKELAHVDGDAVVADDLDHVKPEKAALPAKEFGHHLLDLGP